ncbi:hypothetical protein FJZ23_01450 [Candidatus Parcubacteria bacterium]|nr:hypothetical protein [Candidatus Parcubacteria bacterium]
MINLKRPLIVFSLIALAISPFVYSALATSGVWGSALAQSAWEYDLYRVERLSFGKTAVGPFAFHGGVFMAEQAKSCKYPDTCSVVDVTLLKDGKALSVADVGPRVKDVFWHSAQDGRFIYFVPSSDKTLWGKVFEYLPQSGSVKMLAAIPRKADDLNFVTSAVDGSRVYTTVLHRDKQTGNVKTKLMVIDTVSGYVRDDIAWTLNSRWQEILDVQNNVLLVKVVFEGGFKELLLVDEKARTIKNVPDTWTAVDSDIVAGHLLEDGTVRYFRNYRMFTYTPGDEKPVESGGAHLNWFASVGESVRLAGDRVAYVDPENTLYVTGPEGVSNFGKVSGGLFTLKPNAIYFASSDAYKEYDFVRKTWSKRHFRVTDALEDILVGLDAQGNIWYENLTTGKTMPIGYGAAPVLTDRGHALWRGVDGKIYQATFSPLLDVGDTDVQAYKAHEESTVYLKSGDKMWRVTDEATYFTWFDSWDEVISVSSAALKVYREGHTDMGDAPFAAGTRVKAVGNPRVYVVGSDGSLHWIISETVAHSVYGANWNKGIIHVRPERLWNYSLGVNVHSGDVVRSI